MESENHQNAIPSGLNLGSNLSERQPRCRSSGKPSNGMGRRQRGEDFLGPDGRNYAGGVGLVSFPKNQDTRAQHHRDIVLLYMADQS